LKNYTESIKTIYPELSSIAFLAHLKCVFSLSVLC